jgi:anti-anti-sigma factor
MSMATRRIPVLTETWGGPLTLQAFPVSPWAWVLRIRGEVDASNVKLLEGALVQVFNRGVSRVAVDLGDVPYMSSGCYGCLVSAADRARRNGGVLVIARATSSIREIFDVLGLTACLVFADDFIAVRSLLTRD